MDKLKSRKLWVTLLAPVVVGLLKAIFPSLDESTLNALIGVFAAYLLGQSYVDSKNGSTPYITTTTSTSTPGGKVI